LLKNLTDKISISFQNTDLLRQALIHASYANESKPSVIADSSNERLEFLGDAVLELVISCILFEMYPNFTEGDLTRARAILVCEASLAKVAQKLELGKHLKLGRGEESSGGRNKPAILADALEALIGAIYLDAGLTATEQFIKTQFADLLYNVKDFSVTWRDYKTLLQELVQRDGTSQATYELIHEFGPDHDKIFEVGVSINGFLTGSGTGKSKKDAEQNAAREALEMLNKK